jgi:glycosyltransferase involved in cell wall biosynthesis
MKVLVFTSLFPNNIETSKGIFIKQRMFHFARLDGCEIKVVSPVPYLSGLNRASKGDEDSKIKQKENIDGIEIFHPRYPLIPKISMPFHGFSLFISSLKSIKKIHETFPFDLIDGHYIYPDGLAAVLLGKVFKKPVVLSARGSDINEFPKFRLIRPMIRFALHRADHIVGVCDALKREIMELGIPGDKISVIPNGVDIKMFHPECKTKMRKVLSIPENRKAILSVGSLVPRKGFDILLTAFHRLCQECGDVHLYIIGEGPSRANLRRQIKKLQLTAHVTLLGEVRNEGLTTWYNAADVSCLASSREGWPNVIMESLACGTPVVATRVWGAPEILTSADVGILVDPSPESFHEGLARALATNWDSRKIRGHVENRSWSKVASEVKDIFGFVLKQRRGKSLEN